MIKLIALLKRKPGMTRQAFADRWINEHLKLSTRMPGCAATESTSPPTTSPTAMESILSTMALLNYGGIAWMQWRQPLPLKKAKLPARMRTNSQKSASIFTPKSMWQSQGLKNHKGEGTFLRTENELDGVSPMATKPKICVVGSTMIDLISKVPRLPKLGETLVGQSFHMGYGGKGANQAVMAAKLGAQVTMVNKVGRDVFGEGTLNNFREHGIDTTYVLFDESRFSGVAPILVDDNARNVIVIVPGANLGLLPSDVHKAEHVILAADMIICQLEMPVETTLEAFRIAKRGNVRTILNPAPAALIPEELLRLTDICAPNETETELLTNQTVGTLAEAEAAARQLLSRGTRTVVLTLGERGALLVDKNTVENIPAVKVDAVDPTGAGDAFIGSLAVYLGEGLSIHDAIWRANAVAALSVTRIGTQVSFPDRAEADRFLKEKGLS